MATKYWVGGDGNWSSLTNWRTTSGGAVVTTAPGSADAAVLDANSSTSVVTVDSNITIQTLTCTGFTGTLAFGTNTISLNSIGTVFTGATTMTVTGTPQIICTNSSASAKTITPTAVTEANSISFRITAGSGNLALTAGAYRNLDFTDGTNPTGFGGTLLNSVITIYGNFKASTSGMTRTAGTGTYTFAATSGTKTITTAAVTFDNPFTFDGVGGTWQLQDALTSGAARTCTLTNGTLDLNGYTFTTGLFVSNNSNTRTLAFGTTGNIIVTGNNATVLNLATLTNFTYTGTSVINLTYSGSVGTRTASVGTTGGNETYAVNVNVTAGGDTVTLTSGSSGFKNLNFTGFSGTLTNQSKVIYGNFTIPTGMTVNAGTLPTSFSATSGTQVITTNNVTQDYPLTFNGSAATVYQFADALTQGSTRNFTLTLGIVKFKASTTNVVGSFVTSGTTLKYLQSDTPGTQATISQASGTVTATYLSIQDSNATGGATWNATATSNIDNGNNLGWNFSVQSLTTVVFNRRKRKRLFI